mgnify:CR=1 FL=1
MIVANCGLPSPPVIKTRLSRESSLELWAVFCWLIASDVNKLSSKQKGTKHLSIISYVMYCSAQQHKGDITSWNKYTIYTKVQALGPKAREWELEPELNCTGLDKRKATTTYLYYSAPFFVMNSADKDSSLVPSSGTSHITCRTPGGVLHFTSSNLLFLISKPEGGNYLNSNYSITYQKEKHFEKKVEGHIG